MELDPRLQAFNALRAQELRKEAEFHETQSRTLLARAELIERTWGLTPEHRVVTLDEPTT